MTGAAIIPGALIGFAIVVVVILILDALVKKRK